MSLTVLQLLAALLLLAAIVLSMIRLFIGPTTADRLVAAYSPTPSILACWPIARYFLIGKNLGSHKNNDTSYNHG